MPDKEPEARIPNGSEVLAAVDKSATAVDQSTEQVRLLRVAVVLMTFAVLIMIFISAAAWAIVRSQADELVELSKTASEQRDALLDCTRPEGLCFQESLERQADIIGEPVGPINTVAVAAAYCAVTFPPGTPYERIKTCTEEILAGGGE
jgi:hypothetical protein